MEWWHYCLGGGALVLIIAYLWWRVTPEGPGSVEMAKEAQQEGATHFTYDPHHPEIVFWRTRGDKVEFRTAASGSKGFFWVENWRGSLSRIPEDAKPISGAHIGF